MLERHDKCYKIESLKNVPILRIKNVSLITDRFSETILYQRAFRTGAKNYPMKCDEKLVSEVIVNVWSATLCILR